MSSVVRFPIALAGGLLMMASIVSGCGGGFGPPSCRDLFAQGKPFKGSYCTCSGADWSNPSLTPCCRAGSTDPAIQACMPPPSTSPMPPPPPPNRACAINSNVALGVDGPHVRGTRNLGALAYCEDFVVTWVYKNLGTQTLKSPSSLRLSPILFVEQERPPGHVLEELPKLTPAPWNELKPCEQSTVQSVSVKGIRIPVARAAAEGVNVVIRGLPQGESQLIRAVVSDEGLCH